MMYEKKFEYALFAAGFLIIGSIIFNYLGIFFIMLFNIPEEETAFLTSQALGTGLSIGLMSFFVGIFLAIAILIISRRSEGKKIFSVKKDPLIGVIGIGLGAVGSISMLVGVLVSILYSHGYIPTIMWPALGIFGITANLFEEREFSGLMLIIESLCLSLIVISPLLGIVYLGNVLEYALLCFGVILSMLGGILIFLGEFLKRLK